MSVTESSRTKTETDYDDTVTTEVPEIKDRWSNNITYRQLVMSSCVGIVQLWWHPYVHDLQRLVPFLFMYNLCSIVVGYPLFYLELALGVVTKKGVLNCWDLSPAYRGVGITMLICCAFTALALGTISAYSMGLFVHSFHSFLPWLHCAAAATPPCAARHRSMAKDSDTPAQSFFFNYVLKLRREGISAGLGNTVWELTIYYVLCWVFVYFIAIKKIYSFSKVVLFKDVLAYFTLLSCMVGVFRMEGSRRLFSMSDWSTLFESFKMWREALEYSLLQMSLSTGTLIMLGSYCPKERHHLNTTALVTFFISKVTTVCSALILGGVHGALHLDYENQTNVWKGGSSSMVLWADYVARVPGSQFWSSVVFFTLFVLAITSTALLVQTIMSAFTGRSIRKIAWAFLILICVLYSFVGIFTMCSQGGLYIVNSLMEWPVTRGRVLYTALVSLVVTYVYGQKTFCEDVYFAVGEYPCAFFRVCWALLPGFLIVSFLASMSFKPPADAVVGWTLVSLSLLPITIVFCFYVIFKYRVRNIVSEK